MVLQAGNPTEYKIFIEEMRSTEKPFEFGKVNEHERFLPSMGGTTFPAQQRAGVGKAISLCRE